MKKFIKSYFIILLLLVSIFTISCKNILINNEASISFNLGEDTASYIKNSCKSVTGFSEDTEIKILCSLLKAEKVTLQQSKNVTLKNLGEFSFDLRNIPYCNNYKVEISFSYNDIIIFFASSDTIVLNDTNKNPDIKLTIKPAPQKITYNLNGGKFVEAYPINYFITSNLKLPIPIKENSIFSHWELNDGTKILTLGKENFLGGVTLNAKWTEQNITPDTPLYKVTFDANGHGTAPQSIDLPEGADIPINKLAPLTADGYIFGGWFKDNTTFKQKWTPSTDKVQTSPITLYAKWDIKSYKITYETGITQTVEQKTINHGSKLESIHLPTNLTKDQFTFDNWKYKGGSKNGTVAQIGDAVTEDITLEAVWTQFGTTADVVISGPNGNNVEKKGTNITLTCSTPGAQIYYTTDGSDPTTSLSPMSSPATITLNDATTVKAFATSNGNTQSSITTKEFVLTKYTVTFRTSYGIVEPQILTEGSKIIEPPSFSQNGYSLKGWLKKRGATPDLDVLWNFNSDTMPGKDITLEAVWTPWTKLEDVTFSVSSGSVDAGATIILSSVKGSTIYYTTDKSDPKTSKTRTTVVPTDSGNTEKTITINEDTQIKAYATAPKTLDSSIVTNDYTILKYTVTFDANGHGTAPAAIDLPKGSDIPSEKLVPLTADGFNFVGWFKDNNTFKKEWTPSTDKVQASPITLYAKWEIPKETIREDGRIEVFALPINELKTYNFIAEKKYIINVDNALMSKTGATGELTTLIKSKTNIEELIIKNDVSTISKNAFKDCANLKTINLPNTITTTGTDIFAGCTTLTTINYSGTVAQWNAIQNINYCLPNNSTVTGSDFVKLPAMKDTELLNYAYDGTKKYILHLDKAIMIAYNFGSSKQISNFVKGKTNIVGVIFGNDIQTLQSGCFDGCKSIEKITVGTQITDIPTYSFYGCSNLKNIELPANVTTISNSSFKNNPAITGVNIYYTGTLDQWNQIMTNADTDLATLGFNSATVHYSGGTTTVTK